MTEDINLDETTSVDKEARWKKLVSRCQNYANPLASRHQAKKIFKLIKKGKVAKGLRMGVKDIQKSLRKGEKGILILAGDVTPIDVISHLPVLCEKSLIPYCYVPSKEDLGSATGSKRQTCAIMIKEHENYKKLYKECFEAIKNLPLPF